MMNERVKYPVVITAICVVAAAALAYTFALTKDRIAASKESELVKALEAILPPEKKSIQKRVLPGVTAARPKDSDKLYVARENADKTGKALGYAAVGTAQGYSSKIETMVGVDAEMHIIGIRILSQRETPGLGERSREIPPTKSIWKAIADWFRGAPADTSKRLPPFQRQFVGKTGNQLKLVKGSAGKDEISQLTGATVTSQAVVNSVRDALDKIKKAVAEIETASPEGHGE